MWLMKGGVGEREREGAVEVTVGFLVWAAVPVNTSFADTKLGRMGC